MSELDLFARRYLEDIALDRGYDLTTNAGRDWLDAQSRQLAERLRETVSSFMTLECSSL